MQTRQNNGRRRPSRPAEHRNGEFYPIALQANLDLLVCSTCASLIPATDRARARHQQWHAVYGMDRS